MRTTESFPLTIKTRMGEVCYDCLSCAIEMTDKVILTLGRTTDNPLKNAKELASKHVT